MAFRALNKSNGTIYMPVVLSYPKGGGINFLFQYWDAHDVGYFVTPFYKKSVGEISDVL
jgi:hypothetical protein